jgi:50S ribosomal protein L16 3-hydroxylase
MSPSEFMREYWQKKPLLVRGAIPAFSQTANLQSPISSAELYDLAGHDLVESRLIKSHPWRLEHGPHTSRSIPKISQKDWTLLIQGMEGWHPAAATVLSWFRFIPDYRLDDLMISIAGPGGSVGPHLDSYDVFLIQMEGRRNWKIQSNPKKGFVEDLPLKILEQFDPSDEWTLNPGDMLYLPPQIAHEGIALDPGTQTWSVGFRSPSWRELLQETLWRLADQLEDDLSLSQILSDPHQTASDRPAKIPGHLTQSLKNRFNELPWHGKNLEELLEFALGEILSEPKPQVVFAPPIDLLTENEFRAACVLQGLHVHPQTRLTISGDYLFCNGAILTYLDKKSDAYEYWLLFAHQRGFLPIQCRRFLAYPSMFEHIYEGYESGWFELGEY